MMIFVSVPCVSCQAPAQLDSGRKAVAVGSNRKEKETYFVQIQTPSVTPIVGEILVSWTLLFSINTVFGISKFARLQPRTMLYFLLL